MGITRNTAIGPWRSRPALQRKRASAVDLVRPVHVARFPVLREIAGKHDLWSIWLEPLPAERRAVFRRELAVAAEKGWRAGAQMQVGRPGFDEQAQEILELHLGGGQVGRTRTEAVPRPRAAGRVGRTIALAPPGAGRDFHTHLATRRLIAKGERLGAAQPRAEASGPAISRTQGNDLRVGERFLGEEPARAVRQQRRGAAHYELERVRSLLVHHFDQSVESGHGILSRKGGSGGRAPC